MMPKSVPDQLALDFKELVLMLRPDLCRRFGFHKDGKELDFFTWLRITGIKEYPEAFFDHEYLRVSNQHQEGASLVGKTSLSSVENMVRRQRPDVRKAFPLPRKRKVFEQWILTHGVEELNLWPFLSEEQRGKVRGLPEPWQSRLAPVIRAAETQKGPRNIPVSSDFGVNLIGHAFSPSGIGEDVRMAARSLRAVNLPFCVVDFPPGGEKIRREMELESLVVGKGPYPVNIFCLSALEQGRMYAERGGAQMRGRYNIGYWPWELEQWPERWRNLVCLVDEIWVSTRHTLKAVRELANIPVRHMPMAVCTDAPGKPSTTLSSEEDFRHTVRERFSLPPDAYLFCFSFDLNSSIHRKNPEACLQAFQKAFPRRSPWNANGLAEHEVGLVIKIHPPAHTNRQWEKLQRMVKQDSRLHLVIETLPRQELLDLYRACDCFVSLHRAEGFGRGIAEALLLGLDVIATGYSGNVDFCNHPLMSLVPYSLVPVRKGQYPFGEGCRWAEPDVSEAAKIMRKKFQTRGLPRSRVAGNDRFHPSVIGKRYRRRLLEIFETIDLKSFEEKQFPRSFSSEP